MLRQIAGLDRPDYGAIRVSMRSVGATWRAPMASAAGSTVGVVFRIPPFFRTCRSAGTSSTASIGSIPRAANARHRVDDAAGD